MLHSLQWTSDLDTIRVFIQQVAYEYAEEEPLCNGIEGKARKICRECNLMGRKTRVEGESEIAGMKCARDKPHVNSSFDAWSLTLCSLEQQKKISFLRLPPRRLEFIYSRTTIHFTWHQKWKYYRNRNHNQRGLIFPPMYDCYM